ncbi:metallophosphoesterase [Paracoccus sp. ME4]|uniref:metallophosphoesterase n=1 Tax=Paracoccus sp. ME4 TaxID=3138066 RepID=UPI00398B8064
MESLEMNKELLVMSDLHMDLWGAARRDPFDSEAGERLADLEALVIAGDLTNKPKVRWPHALEAIGRRIDLSRVWVMPGNHDYYDFRIDGEDRLAQIAEKAGAHFAQQAELRFGDTRLLCCTLWTDLALHGDQAQGMAMARRRMNDYRYIRMAGNGYGRMDPKDTVRIHDAHRDWLAARLAEPFDGRSIAVTHHAPHPGSVAQVTGDDSDDEDETAPAYASDLRGLIEAGAPDVWFHGHTHAGPALDHGRTRIRNVALGYPDQVEPGREAERLLRGLVEIRPEPALPYPTM